jgi:hypothetical protein
VTQVAPGLSSMRMRPICKACIQSDLRRSVYCGMPCLRYRYWPLDFVRALSKASNILVDIALDEAITLLSGRVLTRVANNAVVGATASLPGGSRLLAGKPRHPWAGYSSSGCRQTSFFGALAAQLQQFYAVNTGHCH